MKPYLIRKQLQVKQSPIHGYGVFAREDIAADDIIEECPVLLTNEKLSLFHDYLFTGQNNYAFALGYGSLYNHAPISNATYIYIPEENILKITAIDHIKKDQEIFIHYGDQWFSSRTLICNDPIGIKHKILFANLGILFARFMIVFAWLSVLFIF